MKTDEIEDGDVCPYCGVLPIFFDGAPMINCPNCASELYNVGLDDVVSGTDLDEVDKDIDDVIKISAKPLSVKDFEFLESGECFKCANKCGSQITTLKVNNQILTIGKSCQDQ